MSLTLIIILVTVGISYTAFNNDNLMSKLILWPRMMNEPKEYYRLITSGFIHADYQHLIFNMITLYFFGSNVEMVTNMLGHSSLYVILYLSGIVAASLPSFLKNRDNNYYRSLGASGGVGAVIFCSIYYAPWMMINFIIPAIVFAIGYLVYSAYMSKRSGESINHDAHFWGSVYGFLFAFAIDPTHGRYFIEALTHPPFLN